jgi:hypothetical protein
MLSGINFQSLKLLFAFVYILFFGIKPFAASNMAEDKARLINDSDGPVIPAITPSPALDADDVPRIPSRIPLMSSSRSAGIPVGMTTQDVQYWSALGRRITHDYSAPPNTHMVWTYQDNFNFYDPSLSIMYQVFNSGTGAYELAPGGITISDLPFSWTASCSAYPDNRFTFACLRDAWANSVAAVYTELSPELSIFSRSDVYPDPDSSWYFEDLITPFPVIEVHHGTDTVVYVLAMAHDMGADETVGLVLYRKVNSAGFDGGQYIENRLGHARDIVALQNTDTVAIVFQDYCFDGDANYVFDIDLRYMISTDQGLTWGPKLNITNYTSDSLWRSAGHFSSLWDSNSELHVIWCARELMDSTAGYYFKSRLLHWSTINEQASIITEARYGLDCDIGPWRWEMNVSKPSLSQCNGKLYALWTQYGDEGVFNDCSEGGFANGELYMAASDDWGVTWDTAVNLTQTRTPNCAPDDCESDHWSSMARYGMIYPDAYDSLDIIYINDRDAGSVFNGKGTWTTNMVMHLRVPCREVVHLPQISADPMTIGYPTIVDTNSIMDTNITIINEGNGDLVWEASINYIDGGQYNWLAVNPSGGLIHTQPSNSQPVTVTFNSTSLPGDPSIWKAEIIVTATDYPGIVSPMVMPVQLIVACDSHQPKSDTLDTGCKALACFNTGRYGGDSPGYSLNIPGDCDTIDPFPDVGYYIYDGSPLISWINGDDERISYTDIYSQNMTEPGTFFPNGDFVSLSEAGYEMVHYTASTTDSLFMVDVTLYAPADGNNCFIVGKNEFYLWEGQGPVTDVYLGQILDWDIPSDSVVENGSGYDADKNVIWQYGGEYHIDNQGNCDIMENNRLGGIALLSHSPRNAWTEPNADHFWESAYNPFYLYSQMSTLSAYSLYEPEYGEDSLVDLHTGMTFDRINMVPGEVYSYTYVLLTTNEGETDFLNQLDAAVDWVISQGTICCTAAPGDANADSAINIGDAVYLISYIFKGGSAPTPYEICSGDANGDCLCNVGDAVYLISYVFKGGPPPVTVNSWINGCGLPVR